MNQKKLTTKELLALKAVVYGCNTNRKCGNNGIFVVYEDVENKNLRLFDLSSLEEKDGGIVCNYSRTITAQIVQAQTEQEMRVVCSAINEYIRKNKIDICYVVNENVLNDLLHNHEQLYRQLLSTEEQNKRVLEKLDIITRSNQELETKLSEQDKELIRLHKNWRNSKIQQQRLYDNVKQQLVEQNKELENKYPFLKRYDNGIFIEYNVVYEREGLVNTICFGKNKEMAENTLKTLMEGK